MSFMLPCCEAPLRESRSDRPLLRDDDIDDLCEYRRSPSPSPSLLFVTLCQNSRQMAGKRRKSLPEDGMQPTQHVKRWKMQM